MRFELILMGLDPGCPLLTLALQYDLIEVTVAIIAHLVWPFRGGIDVFDQPVR